MVYERIVQKDSAGTVFRVLHRDRGLTVGYTIGRVTSQTNSGGFNEEALYEKYHAGDKTPPLAERDWAIAEKLFTIRKKLGLGPLATTDIEGRDLRKLIGEEPTV